MTNFLRMLSLVFATVTLASGQTQQVANPLIIDADYCLFRSDGGKKPYLEIAYAIHAEALKYVAKTADSLGADLLIRVTITTKNDSLWVADMWRTTHEIAIADTTQNQRIVNILRYPIPPGIHKAKIYVRDLQANTESDSVTLEIEQKSFSENELSLSDIELASTITQEKEDTGDIFHKNALRIIPNPSAIYGAERPMLFYYVEIYNLQANMTGPTYRTRAYITDARDALAATIKPREHVKPLIPASVEVGAFNISTLAGGKYLLHFDLLQSDSRLLKSVVRKFFVYNPSVDPTESVAAKEAAKNMFADITDYDISNELQYVSYLCNEAQRQIVQSLTNLQGQRDFLLQFWQERGKEINLPWVQLRNQYLQKVAYVNETFGSFAKAGWRTDRGRVFLIYDRPDDIERFPYTDETKPYEIWTYNRIEGGVEFIFGDRTGFKEFQLLHSTKRGEVKNDNWKTLISQR